MEEEALALLLQRCLAEIDQDGEPDEIAGRYPAHSDELLPLLRVAVTLREHRDSGSPRPQFLRDLGERLRSA